MPKDIVSYCKPCMRNVCVCMCVYVCIQVVGFKQPNEAIILSSNPLIAMVW